jgi:uncharacterized protein
LRVAVRPVTPDFGRVRVVDSHVHLYPPDINQAAQVWAAQAGEHVWSALCTRRRRDGRPVQAFPELKELLATMDDAGVDHAVLQGWYWQTPAACVLQNRFYAACVQAHPDRLAACVTVQPIAAAGALAELRWAHEQGFVGVGELSPHSIGLAVDDGRWVDLLALAGELGLPVNLHVTDPASRPYPGRVDTPLEDFLCWARGHPQTQFVLAHGGGGIARRHPEARDLTNVYFDTAAFPLLYPVEEWGAWVEDLGVDRLLWGSDWPLDLYPRESHRPAMLGFREQFAGVAMDEAARRALLGGNAEAVYLRRR